MDISSDFFADLDIPTLVVVREIVAYLRRYPMAADTCDGIARWWFAADLTANRRIVEGALNALVRAGFLQARRLPSGDLWYHVAPDDVGPDTA